MTNKSDLISEAIKLAKIINRSKISISDKVNHIEVKDPKTNKTYKLQKTSNSVQTRSSNFR